jgi:hypothetical protein
LNFETANTGPDVTTGGAFLQHRLAMMGEVASPDDLDATYSKGDFVKGTSDNFFKSRNCSWILSCPKPFW